jgi:glutathione S-transferase
LNPAELEEVAGTKAIPVPVDGERVITDSSEAISYLEQRHEKDPGTRFSQPRSWCGC